MSYLLRNIRLGVRSEAYGTHQVFALEAIVKYVTNLPDTFSTMLTIDSGLNRKVVWSRSKTMLRPATDLLRDSLDFRPIPLRGNNWIYLTIRPEPTSPLPQTKQSSHPPLADQYPPVLHN